MDVQHWFNQIKIMLFEELRLSQADKKSLNLSVTLEQYFRL